MNTIKILQTIKSDTYAKYQGWTIEKIENLTGKTLFDFIGGGEGKYMLLCEKKNCNSFGIGAGYSMFFNSKAKALKTQKLINKIQ